MKCGDKRPPDEFHENFQVTCHNVQAKKISKLCNNYFTSNISFCGDGSSNYPDAFCTLQLQHSSVFSLLSLFLNRREKSWGTSFKFFLLEN